MKRELKDMFQVLQFKDFGDERGNLVVIEGSGKDLPFTIERVFYIYGSDSTVIRGNHANLNSEFVMINVAGKSKVKVDNGTESEIIELDRPMMGLYLSKMLWKEMYDFSPDSILLVMSSEHYDEAEYIRDYDRYLEIMKEEEDE
ncbi:MAG: FdtA/QdtA family cupin domain-containing protein [Lachnospiraceae bacterium]|nr:FdtA/QdtA family cupin domain-containing protein [Lachnospiraceae bacterium]